ncbi:P-loop containing nucleoside triphosphate hydrolase protein [Cyathus striatus]|nr:P-loop containing nucleoside triphosphate hydrolase protein [Cyathus striatus]
MVDTWAKFNWKNTPWPFQLDAIKALLQRKDVLVHAGTGFGKTMIIAGPHAHEDMTGKVSILVSPLIALQEEQVATFKNEFGLQAIAINSTHGGLTKEHILIDETHVVSHWGSGFHKKYGTLGILKALLPRGTPFAALSATLPPRIRNDRRNVSIVIQAMHHAMNTYRDLDFIIPPELQNPNEIKKTFIYADSLAVATLIEDHLYELCPDRWQYKGFIRPYSAAFSVLICTDAAGMGCNIPDIEVVIQWKLPSSVSSFVQHAGCAARGEGQIGLAVLLKDNDLVLSPVIDIPLDLVSIDEGLYTLVQTGTCRREILTKVRQKRGIADLDVMKALHSWRVEIAKRDFGNALFTGSGILSNDLLELLASVGPIMSMERLKTVLESQWSQWFPKYSTELLTKLQTLSMTPLRPKPRKVNTAK